MPRISNIIKKNIVYPAESNDSIGKEFRIFNIGNYPVYGVITRLVFPVNHTRVVSIR